MASTLRLDLQKIFLNSDLFSLPIQLLSRALQTDRTNSQMDFITSSWTNSAVVSSSRFLPLHRGGTLLRGPFEPTSPQFLPGDGCCLHPVWNEQSTHKPPYFSLFFLFASFMSQPFPWPPASTAGFLMTSLPLWRGGKVGIFSSTSPLSLLAHLVFLMTFPSSLSSPGLQVEEPYIRYQELVDTHKFYFFTLVTEKNLLSYGLSVRVEDSDD